MPKTKAPRSRLAELLHAAGRGDRSARERLILLHLPLVRAVARSCPRRGEPLEDIVQVGSIGLIKAIDRFDPGRGTEFSTYAVPTIVGEIAHHVRDRASCIRVPSSGGEARNQHIDAELVPPADLDEGVTWIDRPPPAETGYARSEDRSLLTNGVRALDERERRVIYRRYFEDLTQSEIAQELGISQVHVSRLLCDAIEKMRKGIEK